MNPKIFTIVQRVVLACLPTLPAMAGLHEEISTYLWIIFVQRNERETVEPNRNSFDFHI